VGASVGPGVERRMGSTADPEPAAGGGLRIRLLGPLEVRRDGQPVPLPASRKVRGLLAWLALATREAPRSQLCELLWDVPNDPRGELRWCLSKMRHVVDDPGRPRLVASEDRVRLDLTGCEVDALEVASALREGTAALDAARAEWLAGRFEGDLLAGLEMDHSPAFAGWLAAQRSAFRALHVALLERVASLADDAVAPGIVARWLELAPFDRHAHERLLGVLARAGRVRDAEEHLRVAASRFEEEGLDVGPVRAFWQEARHAAGHAVVATAAEGAPAVPDQRVGVPPGADGASRRASVAVLPFEGGDGQARAGWAGALARDVITRLARLRSLFVIAEGTALALRERRLAPEAVGRLLGVDYLVVASAVVREGRLAVEVQLDETRTARVLWSERMEARRDDTFEVIEDVGDRIVASVAGEIETNERNRAVLKPPGSLDAWESHHRGLWHAYRFTREENRAALGFFERAVALDPTFSRAHAGVSFAHWQDAFQGWEDRDTAMARSLEAAGRAMLADDRDPAAHWAQGRALWLGGAQEPAVQELEEAVELSPNFAQGHYSLAFVQAQAGDPRAAVAAADRSRRLSPFDPLLFGMLGARAIALVRLGQPVEAAEAAARAAARPNAHAHIHALAALTLALAGSLEEARLQAAAARRGVPGYALEHFLRTFRLDREGADRFAEGARRIGMA
jgi:DNA-binding SARP family transcriptional activator